MSMNKDIRIAVTFRDHRKRKKLQRRLGAEGVVALMDLWLSVAENKPNGVLTNMDEEDIALDAQWDGDAEAFVSALVDLGFLEKHDGLYVVHDWVEHNGYVSSSKSRSDKSRLSRMASTYPKLYSHLCSLGYEAISSKEYKEWVDAYPNDFKALNERPSTVEEETSNDSLTTVNDVEEPLTVPSSPSPSPSPSLKSKKKKGADAPARSEEQNPYVAEIPTQGETPLRVKQSQAEKWQETFRFIDVRAELYRLSQWARDHPEKRWAPKGAFMAASGALNKANQRALQEMHRKDPQFDPNDPDGKKAAEEAKRRTQEKLRAAQIGVM